MILSCPSCAARFVVDPKALSPAGRRVRCVRCGETWHENAPAGAATAEQPAPPPVEESRPAAPPAPEPAPPAALEPAAEMVAPEPAPIPARKPMPPVRQPAMGRTGAAWAVLALVVAAAVAALVFARDPIASAWPPATKLYRLAGLPLAQPDLGLKLEPRQRWAMEGSLRILFVEGEIVNESGAERTVPRVEVALMDAQDRELTASIVRAQADRLGPGERTAFSARLPSPPQDARRVAVRFEEETQ